MLDAPNSGWYNVSSEYTDKSNPKNKFKAGQLILASVWGEETQLYNPDQDVTIVVETDTFKEELRAQKFTPARKRD